MHDLKIEEILHPMSEETAAHFNRFFSEVPVGSLPALQRLRRELVDSKEGQDRWCREIAAIDKWINKHEQRRP